MDRAAVRGPGRPRLKRSFPEDPAAQAVLRQQILDAAFLVWWAGKGIPLDLEAEWERFMADALAHGRKYLSWRAAFQKWLTSDYQRPPPRPLTQTALLAEAERLMQEGWLQGGTG